MECHASLSHEWSTFSGNTGLDADCNGSFMRNSETLEELRRRHNMHTLSGNWRGRYESLLELFGELHPLHFEGFGLVRDGLQLLVELA